MPRFAIVGTLAAALLLTGAGVVAQTAAPKPAQAKLQKSSGRISDDVLSAWNGTAKKLIEMAEDFPEDKYDFRPAPEVRSFRQLLLHIAGVNYMFINAVKGQEVGKAEDDPAPENFRSKKAVVDYLTKSFADGAAVIREKAERGMKQQVKHPFAEELVTTHSLWMGGVEHGSEHYGNLVVYYRLNKMVPPASRPRR